MQNKTKLAITALCFGTLLIGYAIAEYLHTISMTGSISYEVTLEVTWKDTGEPCVSYDWLDMRHQTKTTPRIVIKNVGTYPCNVRWSADVPTSLGLTAVRHKLGNDWSTSTDMTLDVGESEEASWTLTDLGRAPGAFTFTLNLASNPA